MPKEEMPETPNTRPDLTFSRWTVLRDDLFEAAVRRNLSEAFRAFSGGSWSLGDGDYRGVSDGLLMWWSSYFEDRSPAVITITPKDLLRAVRDHAKGSEDPAVVLQFIAAWRGALDRLEAETRRALNRKE